MMNKNRLPVSGTDSQEPLKILALDATHPNERAAGEDPDALYQLLLDRPIDNKNGRVIPEIGNRDAYDIGKATGEWRRALQANLVFAESNPAGNSEERRNAVLTPRFAASDLVFDRHGNSTPGYDWAFCHRDPTPLVWGLIAQLGLRRVIHSSAPHWASRFRNYLGGDLNPDSPFTASELREQLYRFVEARGLVTEPLKIERYTELESITMKDARRLDLPNMYEPFQELPTEVTAKLGLPPGTMTLGANAAKYGNVTGWWAETVLPVGND